MVEDVISMSEVEGKDPKPECPGVPGIQGGSDWVDNKLSSELSHTEQGQRRARNPSETWSPGIRAYKQGQKARNHAQEIKSHDMGFPSVSYECFITIG